MMKKMFVLCLLSLIGAVGVMAQEKTVQISLPKLLPMSTTSTRYSMAWLRARTSSVISTM